MSFNSPKHLCEPMSSNDVNNTVHPCFKARREKMKFFFMEKVNIIEIMVNNNYI